MADEPAACRAWQTGKIWIADILAERGKVLQIQLEHRSRPAVSAAHIQIGLQQHCGRMRRFFRDTDGNPPIPRLPQMQ